LQLDPWLEPFTGALKSRFSKAKQWVKTIDETEGGLEKFSRVTFYLQALEQYILTVVS
jgi:1,4-alpha-glucan branching enzyme